MIFSLKGKHFLNLQKLRVIQNLILTGLQFVDATFLTTYIGLSGKINDHEIRLIQDHKKKSHIDSGYIPLFYFGGGLKLTDFLSVLFDLDAVGSSQLQFVEGSARIHAKYILDGVIELF
jgi:hypothetical protein